MTKASANCIMPKVSGDDWRQTGDIIRSKVGPSLVSGHESIVHKWRRLDAPTMDVNAGKAGQCLLVGELPIDLFLADSAERERERECQFNWSQISGSWPN